MTGQKKYEITKGPSREEIFDALRLCREERTVTINVRRMVDDGSPASGARFSIRLDVRIHGIIAKNYGKDNAWKLLLINEDESSDLDSLEAHYDATSRTGWARVVTA